MKITFMAGALAGTVAVAAFIGPTGSFTVHAAETYGPYPITLKNYSGPKTDSVSYAGQVARHVLHNSLKVLAGKGNGKPNPELKARMMAYYAGKAPGRAILDPVSNDNFKFKQTSVDDISQDKALKGKTFKGLVPGFPGQMTGPEVIEFMIDKAASAKKGFDPLSGYDYSQLLSKFMMGAVFYNQAVDNYLDEQLEADNKPNNKPYKNARHYTGKEHVWDEAWGYFGAPSHALRLSGAEAYGIAKKQDPKKADANRDGMIDLLREMIYAHAYYAASADKGGSSYLHTITQAFIDGRKLITATAGNKLSDTERAKLKGYADVIKKNWAVVIAEATFKYAGSTYKDLQKLQTIIEVNGDATKAFRAYGKHWGELKGFSMALQTSGQDLGEVAVKLNRLIGYGPVLLGGNQIIGIDASGNLETGGNRSMGEYMTHMIKVQDFLARNFNLQIKQNDVTGQMAGLIQSLGESKSAEND